MTASSTTTTTTATSGNDAAAAAEADTLVLEMVATPEGRADPYSRYAALRSLAPVHRSGIGFWVLSRFDDSRRLLRDPNVGKDFSGAARALGLSEEQQAEQAAFRGDHSNMLFAD